MNIDMIEFIIMGKILVPPLKFLLLFLLSAAFFLVFTLIYNWGQWVSVALETKNSLFLFLPSAANEIILPAVTSGLLFSFFSYRRNKINPAAVLLTTALVFIVIFFCFRFTSSMGNSSTAVTFQPFNERRLQITDDGIIYTDRIDPDNTDSIQGIIIRNSGTELPAFRYYESGRLVRDAHPELLTDQGRSININPSNPTFHNTFSADTVLEEYFIDTGLINTSFRNAAVAGGTSYIIWVSVFTVFLMSCMLFRGASTWPLFDFLLILAFHRGVFYLYGLFSREADFITETFFGGNKPADVPLLVIAASGLLIFLIGVLIKLTVRRKSP